MRDRAGFVPSLFAALVLAAVLVTALAAVAPAQATPAITVTPDSLSATLPSGGIATRTLTVANTGTNDLVFNLAITSAIGTSVRITPTEGDEGISATRAPAD